jgi:hypothetical protein
MVKPSHPYSCSFLSHQNVAGGILAQSAGMPPLTLYYLYPPNITPSSQP